VIGVGGICGPEDALEYFIAGATAIQVGSGAFRDPGLCGRIIRGLGSYLAAHGHGHVREIVGTLQGMPEPPDESPAPAL
jgi:dihydroorotate dehydrogenase (NAD+) catalytic subunit